MSEMKHPTDDELEAMAVRLDKGDPFGGVMQRASAILRACKIGDAPDHSDWDAAIEAAAQVALDQEVECSQWFMQTGQHCNVYEQLPIVAERIRQLKKGPSHD